MTQSPYNLSEFINLVSNFEPVSKDLNSEKVIEAHEELFKFLNNIPYSAYFIHDFSQFKYILFSKSIKNLLGIEAEVLIKGGFGKALEYFHPEDRNNIRHTHQALFDYFYQQPLSDRFKLRFDFNFRMLTTNGTYCQILQQSIFTTLTDGKPLYDFSTCTDITLQKKNNRMELSVYKLNQQDLFEPVYYYVVPNTIGYSLSATEFEVLKWSSQGMSSQQIADKSCRSLHTINNHKKRILSKTQSKSLVEAISKIDL